MTDGIDTEYGIASTTSHMIAVGCLDSIHIELVENELVVTVTFTMDCGLMKKFYSLNDIRNRHDIDSLKTLLSDTNLLVAKLALDDCLDIDIQ